MLMKTPRQHGRSWSEADIGEICSLYGLQSASVIAERYGVSRNAIIGVWNRARKAGVIMPPPRPPQRTGAESKRVRKGARASRVANADRAPKVVQKITKPPKKPTTNRLPRSSLELARLKSAPRLLAEIKCEPVGLREALSCQCRYIIGRGPDALALFCGAKVEAGISWCSGHAKIVFEPPNKIPGYLRSAAE